jgi:hypothetical protein
LPRSKSRHFWQVFDFFVIFLSFFAITCRNSFAVFPAEKIGRLPSPQPSPANKFCSLFPTPDAGEGADRSYPSRSVHALAAKNARRHPLFDYAQ